MLSIATGFLAAWFVLSVVAIGSRNGPLFAGAGAFLTLAILGFGNFATATFDETDGLRADNISTELTNYAVESAQFETLRFLTDTLELLPHEIIELQARVDELDQSLIGQSFMIRAIQPSTTDGRRRSEALIMFFFAIGSLQWAFGSLVIKPRDPEKPYV